MAYPYSPNEHLHVTMQGQRLFLVTDFEMVVSLGGGAKINAGTRERDTESEGHSSGMGVEMPCMDRLVMRREALPGNGAPSWRRGPKRRREASMGGSLQGTPFLPQ